MPSSTDISHAVGDYVSCAETYPEQWDENARAFRQLEAAVGRARLNQQYGAGERQRFDLFYPAGPAKGLLVFVHGGYWQAFDRSYWSHLAQGPTAMGWAVAVPSYTLAPEARISEITREIALVIEKAAALVRGPIRLVGHSAGGHLVARMGCRDVVIPVKVRDRVERIVPISPVADLRPLLSTTMNDVLQMNVAEATSESVILHDAPSAEVIVWVGAEERPVFIDQAICLADVWGSQLRLAPGRHHFDVLDELSQKNSPLVNAIIGGSLS